MSSPFTDDSSFIDLCSLSVPAYPDKAVMNILFLFLDFCFVDLIRPVLVQNTSKGKKSTGKYICSMHDKDHFQQNAFKEKSII